MNPFQGIRPRLRIHLGRSRFASGDRGSPRAIAFSRSFSILRGQEIRLTCEFASGDRDSRRTIAIRVERSRFAIVGDPESGFSSLWAGILLNPCHGIRLAGDFASGRSRFAIDRDRSRLQGRFSSFWSETSLGICH